MPPCLAARLTYRLINAALDEIRSINLKSPNEFKIDSFLQLNDVTGMIDYCLAGIGIIQLPSYLLDPYISSGALIEILKPYQAQNVYCYFPQYRYIQPKLRSFINYFL